MAIRNRNSTYPLLAIGCVVLVLFAIAATVVLGLIPVYLPKQTAASSNVYGALEISEYNP